MAGSPVVEALLPVVLRYLRSLNNFHLAPPFIASSLMFTSWSKVAVPATINTSAFLSAGRRKERKTLPFTLLLRTELRKLHILLPLNSRGPELTLSLKGGYEI